MKKIIKIINTTLVIALILSMNLTVFALPLEEQSDVTGIYVEGAKSDIIYSVDVSWGSMEFSYIGASEGVWNPTTHEFDDVVDATWNWVDQSNEITIKNHSNDIVKASVAFSNSIANVEGGFFKDSSGQIPVDNIYMYLASAKGTELDSAPTKSVYFNITNGTINENGKLGTITITLEESDRE